MAAVRLCLPTREHGGLSQGQLPGPWVLGMARGWAGGRLLRLGGCCGAVEQGSLWGWQLWKLLGAFDVKKGRRQEVVAQMGVWSLLSQGF